MLNMKNVDVESESRMGGGGGVSGGGGARINVLVQKGQHA